MVLLELSGLTKLLAELLNREEGGDRMEVEANKIKTLERLTVNWFEQQTDIINVVLYNGEYYCIDDPVLLDKHTADKVKIRVIAEVNSEEELYKEYFRNIVRAPLNPYAIFLLAYKKGYITGIPKEYLSFIEKNKDLPLQIVESLNEQLIHFKLITAIEPAVLSSIRRLLEEAAKYGMDTERLLKEILTYVEAYVESSSAYPDAVTLYSAIMYLILEEYRKRRKEEEIEVEGEGEGGGREGREEEEKEKGKKFEDINIDILDQKQILPIPAIASASAAVPMPIDTPTTDTTTTTTNVVDSADSNYDSNNSSSSSPSRMEKKQEVNMVERTIAFKITYPAYKEGFVVKLINKILSNIERICKGVGLTIQTT
ncbi:MAG: hypothetical protein QXM92_01990 [Candidatus Anstonellales archaeon]